jgi:hypothetical protein
MVNALKLLIPEYKSSASVTLFITMSTLSTLICLLLDEMSM